MAERGLLLVRVRPELFVCTDIRAFLNGNVTDPEMVQKIKSLVSALLNCTEPASFSLGIGLWLSLVRHTEHPFRGGPPLYCAKAVQNAIKNTAGGDEKEITPVMLCMANHFQDFHHRGEPDEMLIKYFFAWLGIGSSRKCTNTQIRNYTHSRAKGISHDEALFLTFPIAISTWLFLRDVDNLLEIVARLQVDHLSFRTPQLFLNIGWMFYEIARMIQARQDNRKKAGELVTKLQLLFSLSLYVRECYVSPYRESGANHWYTALLDILRSLLGRLVNEVQRSIT